MEEQGALMAHAASPMPTLNEHLDVMDLAERLTSVRICKSKRHTGLITPASTVRPQGRRRIDPGDSSTDEDDGDKENMQQQQQSQAPGALPSVTPKRMNLVQEELSCSICLELCARPCTTPCGHSFCRSCLRESLKHNHRCPKCRKALPPRFDLTINTTLWNTIQLLFPATKSAPITPPASLRELPSDQQHQQQGAMGPAPARVVAGLMRPWSHSRLATVTTSSSRLDELLQSMERGATPTVPSLFAPQRQSSAPVAGRPTLFHVPPASFYSRGSSESGDVDDPNVVHAGQHLHQVLRPIATRPRSGDVSDSGPEADGPRPDSAPHPFIDGMLEAAPGQPAHRRSSPGRSSSVAAGAPAARSGSVQRAAPGAAGVVANVPDVHANPFVRAAQILPFGPGSQGGVPRPVAALSAPKAVATALGQQASTASEGAAMGDAGVHACAGGAVSGGVGAGRPPTAPVGPSWPAASGSGLAASSGVPRGLPPAAPVLHGAPLAPGGSGPAGSSSGRLVAGVPARGGVHPSLLARTMSDTPVWSPRRQQAPGLAPPNPFAPQGTGPWMGSAGQAYRLAPDQGKYRVSCPGAGAVREHYLRPSYLPDTLADQQDWPLRRQTRSGIPDDTGARGDGPADQHPLEPGPLMGLPVSRAERRRTRHSHVAAPAGAQASAMLSRAGTAGPSFASYVSSNAVVSRTASGTGMEGCVPGPVPIFPSDDSPPGMDRVGRRESVAGAGWEAGGVGESALAWDASQLEVEDEGSCLMSLLAAGGGWGERGADQDGGAAAGVAGGQGAMGTALGVQQRAVAGRGGAQYSPRADLVTDGAGVRVGEPRQLGGVRGSLMGGSGGSGGDQASGWAEAAPLVSHEEAEDDLDVGASYGELLLYSLHGGEAEQEARTGLQGLGEGVSGLAVAAAKGAEVLDGVSLGTADCPIEILSDCDEMEAGGACGPVAAAVAPRLQSRLGAGEGAGGSVAPALGGLAPGAGLAQRAGGRVVSGLRRPRA